MHFLGHDRVGEEINEAIAKRLKLSQKTSRVIVKLTGNHMRVLNLSMSEKISRRAKYHFFNNTFPFSVGISAKAIIITDTISI